MVTHPLLQLRGLRVLALCATAVLAAGCSAGSPESVSANGPIMVETSEAYVTFQNKTGLPLNEVNIVIQPYGPGQFTRVLNRIENTGRRQVPLNEFRGRDGTPFNLRVARPKTVKVTAQDAAGKSYELEIPWK